MKRIQLLGLLFGVGTLMTACGPYTSRSFHVAQLDEKGDLQAGGYISAANGFELQADYAWGDRFYTPADFTYSIIKSGDNGFRSNAYSLGLGYYKKMKKSGRFTLHYSPIYGNFGNTNSDYKSHFFGHGLGTDLGWRFNHFEAAFSLKYENFAYLDNNLNYDGKVTTLASALTMRVGGEKFKFHTQIGVSYPIAGDTNVFPYVLNFGLNYRINFKKNKG